MSDRQTTLATFLVDFRADRLAPSTIDQATFVIADTVAAIACGAAEPEVVAITGRIGGPPGAASVVGAGRTAAPAEAALLNGIAGTWLELDEGNRFARGHPGIHVLPAVLAHAEAHGSSGADLITAFVLGYEVASRVGIAAQLRASMHPHGTWGTIGAAAAVAKLAGVDAATV
ncbi:MAG: MmgE/PrpD family protein, partial [Alphaproteobacteria bacterium]